MALLFLLNKAPVKIGALAAYQVVSIMHRKQLSEALSLILQLGIQKIHLLLGV